MSKELLETIVEGLNDNVVSMELYYQNGEPHLFLSHDGSTGCFYKVESLNAVAEFVKQYLVDNFSE